MPHDDSLYTDKKEYKIMFIVITVIIIITLISTFWMRDLECVIPALLEMFKRTKIKKWKEIKQRKLRKWKKWERDRRQSCVLVFSAWLVCPLVLRASQSIPLESLDYWLVFPQCSFHPGIAPWCGTPSCQLGWSFQPRIAPCLTTQCT